MAKVSNSWQVLAPAFLVSELKKGLSTGLNLLLPLLIIDILVATVIVALGYESLNPHLIALPLKLALFLALDGWMLITTNLISTYIK